jgi:hypothetical protein
VRTAIFYSSSLWKELKKPLVISVFLNKEMWKCCVVDRPVKDLVE